jgi:uncharacterized membrane protein YkoI
MNTLIIQHVPGDEPRFCVVRQRDGKHTAESATDSRDARERGSVWGFPGSFHRPVMFHLYSGSLRGRGPAGSLWAALATQVLPDKESAMTKSKVLLPVIGLGVVGMLTFGAWAGRADEEEVALEQVPAAVRATILKESAGGRITEIERETTNGKTVYEAEFVLNGDEIEIKVAPDGTLLGREVEQEGDDEDDLTIDQMPEPARGVLLKLAGGAKIVKAEREKEHGVLVYEAEWVVNGTKHEAAVTADGTLIETEEIVPVEKLPAAVRSAIAKHFGPKAKVVVEKKMIVVYEIEARGNGKEQELLVFPTGRVHEDADDDHEDDDDNEDDDDDDDD